MGSHHNDLHEAPVQKISSETQLSLSKRNFQDTLFTNVRMAFTTLLTPQESVFTK